MKYLPWVGVFVLIITCCLGTAGDDYYELLGIGKDADTQDIRKAFKKLALLHHPDKNKDDPKSHEKFLKINRAYEVLKDDVTRKKYDLHGEEGLKDNFVPEGQYKSWSYYQNNFGIYDDDPQVITLNRADFEQSVTSSGDLWIINYYSPMCSHCHHLAPVWREVAREIEGVVRVGAVNCEDEWYLCQEQNIRSYPSIMFYPQQDIYRGDKTKKTIIKYILDKLPMSVIELTKDNLQSHTTDKWRFDKPWMIVFCDALEECADHSTQLQLSAMLSGMVSVAIVKCYKETKLCTDLGSNKGAIYYTDGSLNVTTGKFLDGKEVKELANQILELLPSAIHLKDDMYATITKQLDSNVGKSWLIYFSKNEPTTNSEVKKLITLLPNINVGHVDCDVLPSVCKQLYIKKYPTFMAFKLGGGHEVHYGRMMAPDVAFFVKESITSNVRSLSVEDFPDKVINSNEPWFVDFFVPWCPPCLNLLPQLRIASRSIGNLVNFGTLDCTVHPTICTKHGVRSYPTTILYNETTPNHFFGQKNANDLVEFIQDILNPPVVILTVQTFATTIKSKGDHDVWVVDFFAPWCGPCQQLSPHWRRLAKMMKRFPNVYLGQVDCTKEVSVCQNQGVHSYPTIRLYPMLTADPAVFKAYSGWERNAQSLRAWVTEFLPSNVITLQYGDFYDKAIFGTEPWLIDFFVPWCGHCQVFAPELEIIATKLKGKVSVGKIDCEEQRIICVEAGIRAYPTLRYYKGAVDNQTAQDLSGIQIHSQDSNYIITYVEDLLPTDKRKSTPHRDEL